MKLVFGNYGNDTLALLQWLHEQHVAVDAVVSVDTGWAAPGWSEHVAKAEAWVKTLGYEVVRLQSQVGFADLVREQGRFPSKKFQWCAGFLKGLPLLAWLDEDEQDPGAEATVILPHRRAASRARLNLQEHEEENEHFGDRACWYPLFRHDDAARNALLTKAGWPVMPHRSLECDPCVNSNEADVLRMDVSVIERTAALEQEMQAKLLDESLYSGTADLAQAIKQLQPAAGAEASMSMFDMGCGSPFGCGS